MSGDKVPILIDLHKNIFFDEERGQVVILDRRLLPRRIEYYRCHNYEEVAIAIEKMVTQSEGVSIAGGYGILIAAYEARNKDKKAMQAYLTKAIERIKDTRPTQSSLHYFVDRLGTEANNAIGKGETPFEVIKRAVITRVDKIGENCRKVGQYASQLVRDNDTVLTHCYAGPIIYFTGYYAKEDSKKVKFFCTETRPYMQGARLTSFVLKQAGFDVTLITDSMPAYCMQQGLINKVFVGADRVSMDGGATNKIGTYQIAIAAHEHNIPFYCFSMGPDSKTLTYKDTEIEIRNPEELLCGLGEKIVPEGVKGFYPAFDSTPPKFIDAIITNRGIYPPTAINRYFEDKKEEI